LHAEIGDFCHDQAFLVVSAPLANNIVPCITEPTTHDLIQAKILSKGFLSIGACVENSFMGRGQELKVSLACKNESSVNVDRVRVKLVELIEYKAQDEKNTFKNELVDMKDIDLPGLVKYRSKDNARKMKQQFSKTKDSTYQQILADLTARQNQFQITIPESTRDTYDGDLISISHYLKITYYTQMGVENPSMKIPIVVGTPRVNPGQGALERAADERIVTIVGDSSLQSDTPDLGDESTVEVGYGFTDALGLPSQEQMPNVVVPEGSRSVSSGAPIFFYDSSDEEDDSHDENELLRSSTPVPSAPDETLLPQERFTVASSMIGGQRSTLDRFRESTPPVYAPFALYSNPSRASDNSDTSPPKTEFPRESSYPQECKRNRLDSYATEVSALTEPDDEPQMGQADQYATNFHDQANSQQLLARLLRELRSSIHDYEVIKARRAEYRLLYSSLTPKELGQIVVNVSMAHQVQVAVLLARYVVMYKSSFTCAHCVEAIKKTSSYFRTNMAETLLPFCQDIEINRHLVEAELNDWERCVTKRAFEDSA
jgi:hypothetical protein